jgi:hypothetical protein
MNSAISSDEFQRLWLNRRRSDSSSTSASASGMGRGRCGDAYSRLWPESPCWLVTSSGKIMPRESPKKSAPLPR